MYADELGCEYDRTTRCRMMILLCVTSCTCFYRCCTVPYVTIGRCRRRVVRFFCRCFLAINEWMDEKLLGLINHHILVCTQQQATINPNSNSFR